MFRVAALIVLLGVAAAQNAITIRVTGAATSENVESVGTAVTRAVAQINSACEAGNAANLTAQTQAIKVITAAATATASGGIFMNSTGAASGNATVAATSQSTATAIAKAVAEAIATVLNGPSAAIKLESIYSASKSVSAQIDIDGSLQGTGSLIAASAASATAFVNAVAEALAAAAAQCADVAGTPTATVAVGGNATAFGVPSVADFVSTQSVGNAISIGDGFSLIRSNSGLAQILNSTVSDSLPPVGVPAAADIVPASTLISTTLCNLGVVTTGC